MEGEMKEYVACKMVCNQAERSLKMMQPVLIHNFEVFRIQGSHHLVTPLVPGSILIRYDPENELMSKGQTKYC